MSQRRARSFALLASIATLAIACAQGSGTEDGGVAGEGGRADGATGDGGGSTDGGPATDRSMPDLCGGVVCEGFERCVMGTCMPFEDCVSDDECGELEVCRHRFCIPADYDVDGDGYGAGDDCDETNPDVSPGAPEVCNLEDDNCSGMADDGDPGLMCADNPTGGVCMDGTCGCPDGVFDVDLMPENGCECVATPLVTEGNACAEAIDLGDVADSGQTVTVSGNVLPADREIFYTFRGVDSADTACDNYHVRVRLTENPDMAYGFQVFRGGCGALEDLPELPEDYVWATDMREALGGRLAGQCPCTASGGTPTVDVSICENDTATYIVRVVRRPGAPVSCMPFTLEVTNGVFDWP